MLHATAFRVRYAAALTLDFARIPFTSNRALFDDLARSGKAMLALHLHEALGYDASRVRFVAGHDRKLDPRSLTLLREVDDGHGALRIAINAQSFFEGVSPQAWHLRIGGYQVCHKWLLDRARAGLLVDQAVATRFAKVVALAAETHRIVNEIDEHVAAAGGFPAAFI